MEKVWRKMQFNPAVPVHVPFKTRLFRPPTPGIKLLRRLAQKGRVYREHVTREQQGRPKLVLGIPNDAQNVAKLVALAHGPGSARAVDDTRFTAGSKRPGDRVGSSSVASKYRKRTDSRRARRDRRTNASGGEVFIPPRTLVHLEEMLSADEGRVEDE